MCDNWSIKPSKYTAIIDPRHLSDFGAYYLYIFAIIRVLESLSLMIIQSKSWAVEEGSSLMMLILWKCEYNVFVSNNDGYLALCINVLDLMLVLDFLGIKTQQTHNRRLTKGSKWNYSMKEPCSGKIMHCRAQIGKK